MERKHDHLGATNFASTALVIENTKVFVSRELLCLHSIVFDTLFFGGFRERHEQEIEMKDINLQEFLDLLDTLHPIDPSPITEASVFHILKLADRFDMQHLIRKAEHYITYKWDSKADKMLIAVKFRLSSLQKYCIDYGEKDDFVEIMGLEEYSEFSSEIKEAIQERLNSINVQQDHNYLQAPRSPAYEPDSE